MASPRMGGSSERSAAGLARAGRLDPFIVVFAALTALAAVGLTVNPWSRDGWYQTQYFLIGHFPGHDNYTPIAAPALLYAGAHGIAKLLGLDIAGEFYTACILQNLMLFASACFLYRALARLRFERLAGPIAVVFLLFALSTGVAQQFYSEATSIFLMSGVALALVSIPRNEEAGGRGFWAPVLVCAVLVGLLVATRMTPIFLIPGAVFLLYGRIPARRLIEVTATLTAVTAALVASVVLANHARFGRYEITNSTGRHLWQGVKDFSDRALAHSARYQALKRIEPHVQGKYWDDLPPVAYDASRVDPREALLLELSKEAIRNAPGLYLMSGASKFVKTIGRAPTRDAFYRFPGDWNPLHRTTNLPALLDVMHAPRIFAEAIEGTLDEIYAAFTWAYPISIFAVALTSIVVVLRRTHGTPADMRGAPRARLHRDGICPAVAILYALGIILALLPLTRVGLRPDGVAASAVCALILGFCAAVMNGSLHEPAGSQPPEPHARLLLFCALLFFGSLWFTWQVEVAVSRYALPYLPFWAIMLSVSLVYWSELTVALRRRGANEAPQPSVASSAA